MAQVNQANQVQFAGYAQQLAGIAKNQVRNANQDIFAKYGPEIEMHLSGMTPETQTVANLELVVNLVRGAHVDELVEDALRERGAVNAEPMLRSTGGDTAPTDAVPKELTMEDERVPEHWREKARNAGITDDTVNEWCQLQGISKKKFYSDFERNTITAPEAS